MRVSRLALRSVLALAFFCAGGIALSGCSGGGGTGLSECEDGLDNDGDLLIDELDPACIAGATREAEDPVKACVDGLDNDGDGLIDGADPGCTGAEDDDEFNPGPPACNDGVDNDGDGRIDYPNDPGCLNANQESEADDCPDGPNCPQCSDGVDNDGDDRTDFPNDTGCATAADDDEFILDTSACGVGTPVAFLPADGMVSGTIGTGVSGLTSPTCGGRGKESVYVVQIDRPVTMVATTDNPGTMFNSVLYLRSSCRNEATERACNDDISPSNTRSTLTVDLTPGVYFLVVDGRDLASSGAFVLKVNFYVGAGETCADMSECAPGYLCRAVPPSTTTTCERPVCSDGRDDDGDGLTDFPNDPGCTDADDSDETDTCPGAGCPACGDGVDNDGDGFTDFPDDIGCQSASGDSEIDCVTETDPLVMVTQPVYTGTTVGATNDHRPTCGSTTNTAPDVVHYIDLQVPVQTLTITTVNTWDSAISVLDSTCGTSLACADPNTLTLTAVAPGAYGIVMDGWGTGSGAYTMTIRGDLTAGADCEDPLVASGVLLCPSGYACQGTAGSRTCQPAGCNDGTDDDGDGLIDYPNDPGCTSPSDPDETDDCPSGPTCPVCSNGIDDDGDGQTDYPTDLGCSAASGTTEVGCAIETDPLIQITAPATSGTTVGASNSLTPTCGSSSHTAPERAHMLSLRIPVRTLAVNLTSSFDAATSLTDATCGTTIQCSDPNSFTRTNLAAGTYGIIVDGWGTGSGTYTLNVSATLNAGDSCEDPLVAAGVISCPTSFACSGPAGTRTCQMAACADGMDNDGDGRTDYPADPGCVNSSDNDEADNCPSGPGCPQCSNGLDDDGDGQTDYPTDTSCVAASDNTELGCGAETDDVTFITGPATSGTTVGASNSLIPTCGSSVTQTAPERVHLLDLAVPVSSLTVNLTSSFDAATSILDGTCGSTLQCSDPNSFTRTNMAPGRYAISVDGWSSGSGTYTLNLAGTLAPNGSCADPLVAAGVLTCPSGYACAGPAGSEVCTPAACNDAIDADGDGFPGYPTDPGCTGPNDNDETDDCPTGPNCPVCSNGADDDGDGLTDYPMDFGCSAASGTTEVACAVETDPLGTVTAPLTTGTTVGAANNFTPTCQSSSLGDRVYFLSLTVPVATLRVDTENSTLTDTILMVTGPTCGLPPIACDDDSGTTPALSSLINLTNVAAGNYAIVVDTYGSATPNAFNLNVRGTIASGVACTDPLVAAGVLACAAGTTCQAGVCSP
ncbi:MAG: hypothetical protein R3B06_21615 [Kofleriaceae bacterium]